MSYILEALKKAQAERQLGSSPTIHAPTLQAETAGTGGRGLKKSVLLAVLAMAAVIVVLLVMVLRPAPGPVPMPAPTGSALVAPASAASIAAATPGVRSGITSGAGSVPTSAPTPLPAPTAELPPSVVNLARAPAPSPASAPTPVSETTPQVSAAGAPQSAAAKPTAASAAAAPSDEPVVNLRDLPEPIQRSIPAVAVGGYIYSKNAADRLLLVDKVLRHEGEEVAPGLILEKLQPKEAVFNFKGYRYRVPY
jgi:general secretion pathway protein B